MYKTFFIILLIVSIVHSRSLPLARSLNSICYQDKRTGVCKAYIPRYYYNETLGSCEEFIYGGCDGNQNNFNSKLECLSFCSEPNPEQNIQDTKKSTNQNYHCKLPMDMGMCFAYYRRFYYKSDESRCVEFIFGGCRGNDNNFDSLAACRQVCEK